MNQQERIWLNNARALAGSFLKTFAMACFAADDTNFAILRPALKQLMEKYGNYSKER